MPTVQSVERQIQRREGFKVQFRNQTTGRDVKGNYDGLPSYPYKNMARNHWSVKRWKEERFNQYYSGFNARILRADGYVAHGGTLLATVRDTYLEE